MSITDIAAGRMGQASGRTFGTRRVPPMPARPRPEPVFGPLWRAACSYAQSATQLPTLLSHRLPSPESLPALRQSLPSFARLPGFLLRSLQSLAAALKPNEAWSREAAIRALLYSNASTTFVRLLAYMCALALLALTVTYLVRSNPKVFESQPAAPIAEWSNVAKPYPAFSMPMSELADSGYDYAMRRNVSGGGRQDILTWGAINGPAPHMMLEIYRPGTERAGFDGAALEIAARLHGIDAATIRPAGEMETKFGPVSLVEFSTTPVRQCLGFVRAYGDPPLQILGWHCVDGAAPVEHDLAACALDRLTLLAAGSEPKVRELFARAELKRNFCGQRSHLFAPTPRLGPSALPPDPRRGR